MKKIFLLLNIFAVCLLASCNKNEFATFDDKDAFVAFGKASYAIAEDGVTTINTQASGVIIVKVAEETVKVVK